MQWLMLLGQKRPIFNRLSMHDQGGEHFPSFSLSILPIIGTCVEDG
jgi:hypothetical protein